MKTSTRILFSIIGSLTCYLFIYFPLSLIMLSFEKDTLQIIAFVIAALIGWFLWLITKNISRKFVIQLIITPVITGGIGYVIGFIGPIIFQPENNLGPLLGLFITGPLSFVFGLVGGGIFWRLKIKKDR